MAFVVVGPGALVQGKQIFVAWEQALLWEISGEITCIRDANHSKWRSWSAGWARNNCRSLLWCLFLHFWVFKYAIFWFNLCIVSLTDLIVLANLIIHLVSSYIPSPPIHWSFPLEIAGCCGWNQMFHKNILFFCYKIPLFLFYLQFKHMLTSLYTLQYLNVKLGGLFSENQHLESVCCMII